LPTLRHDPRSGALLPGVKIPEQSVNNDVDVMERLKADGKLPERPEYTILRQQINEQMKKKKYMTPEELHELKLQRVRAHHMRLRAIKEAEKPPVAPTRKDLQPGVRRPPPPPEGDKKTVPRPGVLKPGVRAKAPTAPTRAPGVRPGDPFVKQPLKPGVRGQKPPAPPPKNVPKPGQPRGGIISLKGIKGDDESLIEHRTGSAIAFNGAPCIATPGDLEGDEILLKNGFSYIGKSILIPVRNPKGFLNLYNFLTTKYVVPPANKKALQTFYKM
jgi:hypothetical protein